MNPGDRRVDGRVMYAEITPPFVARLLLVLEQSLGVEQDLMPIFDERRDIEFDNGETNDIRKCDPPCRYVSVVEISWSDHRWRSKKRASNVEVAFRNGW